MMAIVVSIGKWGNVYFYRGFGWRLCLGWIAITILPMDGDVILDWASRFIKHDVIKEGQNET